jgi:hypothetical protein
VRGCKQPGLQPGCSKFFSSVRPVVVVRRRAQRHVHFDPMRFAHHMGAARSTAAMVGPGSTRTHTQLQRAEDTVRCVIVVAVPATRWLRMGSRFEQCGDMATVRGYCCPTLTQSRFVHRTGPLHLLCLHESRFYHCYGGPWLRADPHAAATSRGCDSLRDPRRRARHPAAA